MLKALYLILGFLTLVLGIIGIIIPGLPTTPFLLLSAALFLKSSKRIHNWLISNKLLGQYIQNYQKKGLDLQTLVSALSVMWFMITLSSIFILKNHMVIGIVIACGFVGTSVMIFIHRRKR
jgi:uncharacterized membrane protein YbaN (DUF454 family)